MCKSLSRPYPAVTALIAKCDHCDAPLTVDQDTTISYDLYLPDSDQSLSFCKAACLRSFVDENTYIEELREQATTQEEHATITVTEGL